MLEMIFSAFVVGFLVAIPPGTVTVAAVRCIQMARSVADFAAGTGHEYNRSSHSKPSVGDFGLLTTDYRWQIIGAMGGSQRLFLPSVGLLERFFGDVEALRLLGQLEDGILEIDVDVAGCQTLEDRRRCLHAVRVIRRKLPRFVAIPPSAEKRLS